jgi:hypothetical protein
MDETKKNKNQKLTKFVFITKYVMNNLPITLWYTLMFLCNSNDLLQVKTTCNSDLSVTTFTAHAQTSDSTETGFSASSLSSGCRSNLKTGKKIFHLFHRTVQDNIY